MRKIEILAIGTNKDIVKVIVRLINANPSWNASASLNAVEAKTAINDGHYDLVLIGAGLQPAEEEELLKTFSASRPDIAFVKHYGGGSGLLFAEIYQALNTKPAI
jgi:DNA-binding NtrC family response regulator